MHGTNDRLREAATRALDAADAAGVPVRSLNVIAHDLQHVPGCSVSLGLADLQSPDPRLRYPIPGTARAVLALVAPGVRVELDHPYAVEPDGPVVQSLTVRPADGVVYRVSIAALSPEVAADVVVEAVLAS